MIQLNRRGRIRPNLMSPPSNSVDAVDEVRLGFSPCSGDGPLAHRLPCIGD